MENNSSVEFLISEKTETGEIILVRKHFNFFSGQVIYTNYITNESLKYGEFEEFFATSTEDLEDRFYSLYSNFYAKLYDENEDKSIISKKARELAKEGVEVYIKERVKIEKDKKISRAEKRFKE